MLPSYANVYQGRLLKDSSGIGVGIAEMLRHLKNGRTCAGIPYEFLTPEQAEEELHRQEQNIHQIPQSIVHLLLNKERRQEAVVEWCRCYEKMVEAKIVQVRRNYFFGENRRLDDLIRNF